MKSRSLDNSFNPLERLESTSELKKNTHKPPLIWKLSETVRLQWRSSKICSYSLPEISMYIVGNRARCDLRSDPGQVFFCMTQYYQHSLTGDLLKLQRKKIRSCEFCLSLDFHGFNVVKVSWNPTVLHGLEISPTTIWSSSLRRAIIDSATHLASMC